MHTSALQWSANLIHPPDGQAYSYRESDTIQHIIGTCGRTAMLLSRMGQALSTKEPRKVARTELALAVDGECGREFGKAQRTTAREADSNE